MQSCGPLRAAVAATWIGVEGAIIEIGLHPAERRDQALGADHQSRSASRPSRTSSTLEVNSTATSIAPGTCRIEGGGFSSKYHLGIGEIGEDDQLVAAGKADEVAIEIELGDVGGRVRGIADDNGERPRDRVHHGALERPEIVLIRRRRQRHRMAAPAIREAEGVDQLGLGQRIASPGAVIACAMLAKPSFDRIDDDHLRIGIELHAEAALRNKRPGRGGAG